MDDEGTPVMFNVNTRRGLVTFTLDDLGPFKVKGVSEPVRPT